jgi:hypothetical protein
MSEQEAPVISHVYIWQNGLVMVFDQFGEQMPEYQGEEAEMLPKIREVYSGTITWAVWKTGEVIREEYA